MKKKQTKKTKQDTVMGLDLASSMTVDKQSIHYATSSHCDCLLHIIF